MNAIRHPLGQAVLLAVGSFVVIKYGIPMLPGSAPVPNSVVLQYMVIALAGILLYVSESEERWAAFRQPLHETMIRPDRKAVRVTALTAAPILVGLLAFNMARPSVGAAVGLRTIHPAPPGSITFQGRSISLTGLENPLRGTGNLEEHYMTGRQVYYQNCLPCHGDLLDGNGHFAIGYNPLPLALGDPGTIDQLQESFLFWRIAKGGPGLNRESQPWNSAMPIWEDFLTEDEIWAVILFLYEQAGLEPRTWEEEGGEHE